MSLNKLIGLFTFVLFLCACGSDDDNRHEFDSFDQTKISFTDEGNGQLVLLLHGFIVDGSSWENAALKSQLLNQGYRVIIPDLRGNGNSGKPQNEDAYKNDAEIKDLIALMDHLGADNYMAVGYSRGSIVLAKLLTSEKRITKAVFGGMGLDFTNPEWDRRIAFADAFSGRAEPDEMTSGAVEYAESINADLKILGYLQDYQPHVSTEELNTITIETLVIAGDQDTANGNPEDLQQQLPNSELAIVSGDHNNTYMQEDFAEEVIDFLN